MTEQKANTYSDDDMRQVISEIEEMDDEAEGIMASARGKVQGIRKRQKNRKKIAKELGIPMAVLGPLLKQRKLERQLQKNAEDVGEEWAEVFVDASGQFSLFAPADGPVIEGETAAQAAARQHREKAAANEAEEQAEGEKVLEEMVSGAGF